jgi:hypothetical protein
MKKELKDLLHRLLWSIIKDGEAGVSNAIEGADVLDAEYESNYLLTALGELKHLEMGEEVDFECVEEALNYCIWREKSIKVKAKEILDYGCCRALEDFYGQEKEEKSKELYPMYHPNDELLDELVELLEK